MPPQNQTPPEFPPDAPSVADGRYVLLARIDQGGMAGVYRAWDEKLKVQRAIKILFPEYHRNTKIRARFDSEARTMARLEHNHLVRIYDVGGDSDLSFLVMELVTGGTLQRWTDVNGPMPPQLALDVALQLIAGVRFVHDAGIVHRDIKPHNVLVAPPGICKLTDFGIAHDVEGFITKTGTALGTQGFMAPEQRTDAKSVDQRADVFGIGATLWALLTAKPAHDLFLLGPNVLDVVPPSFETLMRKTLAYDRAARYPDAPALEAAVRELRQGLGELPAGTPGLPTPAVPTLGDDDDEYGLAEIAELLRDRDSGRTTPVVEEAQRTPPTPAGATASAPPLPYFMPSHGANRTSLAERRAAATDTRPDYLDDPSESEKSEGSEVIGAGLPTWKEPPPEPPAPPPEAGGKSWATPAAEPAEAPPEARKPEPRKPEPRKPDPPVTVAPDPPAPPPEPAEDGGPVWLLYLLVPILGVVATVFVFVLGVGAVGFWSARSVGRCETAAIESRDKLYEALTTEAGAVQSLRETGADVTDLETAFAGFLETKGEPERSEAAEKYLVVLDVTASRALEASATSAQSAAAHSVRRIRARQEAWDNAQAEWRSTSAAFPGNMAVGLGLAHGPP